MPLPAGENHPSADRWSSWLSPEATPYLPINTMATCVPYPCMPYGPYVNPRSPQLWSVYGAPFWAVSSWTEGSDSTFVLYAATTEIEQAHVYPSGDETHGLSSWQ